jgi:c-di-GMP-binding flagellar brake protein YcgR
MSVHNGILLASKDAARRRWRRFRLDMPLRLIIHREKTSIISSRGSDISEGGLLIFAGVELKEGEEIFVEFTPPYSGEPIRVRGIVRNRQGYKYGVEFLWNSPEEEEQTVRFRSLLNLSSSGNVM